MTTLHAIADEVLAALETGEDGELTADAADKLPLMYQRINVELNREQVLQDYRAGLPLPAGVSVEQSFHLRVK
jgi:hypothetical protein